MNRTNVCNPVLRRAGVFAAALFILAGGLHPARNAARPADSASIPPDFPSFRVAGFEKEMAALRGLYWEHFIPEGLYWDEWLYAGADGNPPYPKLPAGPKATLWDEWLSGLLLWPAIETNGVHSRMVERWKRKLSTRRMDADGYVDTDQGVYFAHSLGWPFPVWSDGKGGQGWHFSFKDTPGWYRPNGGKTVGPEGWMIQGGQDRGRDDGGWNMKLLARDAALLTPSTVIDSAQAPFLELHWAAAHLGPARPRLQWATLEHPEFGPDRIISFAPPESNGLASSIIPVYKHPLWKGRITRLRIGFGNEKPGADIRIQAFFSAYDTRHNINNMNFARGSATCFWITGDVDYLRRNIDRIRTALKYAVDEHHVRTEKIVLTTWPGHDGLGSVKIDADGKRSIREGHGLSDNWWDILPFGYKDFYATVHLYDALLSIARLEEDIRAHPEWKVAGECPPLDPADLRHLAAEIRARGNEVFWNPATGRFVACIDSEGQAHDYGFVSPNLESVYFDFATPGHARSILDWVSGARLVDGDTARGGEIYRWIFAPLTTTRHNPDWWSWPNQGGGAWGSGVQDGGCVLGYSYYDLMARLKILGPDNAWARLKAILGWFIDVQAAGGYKEYYARRGGSLQSGNVGGNLGLTQEFWESAMVSQIMLNGFMGYKPEADGFALRPALPREWPELTIDRISLHGRTMTLTAAPDQISVTGLGGPDRPWRIRLPGRFRIVEYIKAGQVFKTDSAESSPGNEAIFEVDGRAAEIIRFKVDAETKKDY